MCKYCLFTNDVESTSIWLNTLRDETGNKVKDYGLPLLLDLYDKYSFRTTFYITGHIAKKYPKIVYMISDRGHEIGSHGLSHRKEHGFDVLSFKDQVFHLGESKNILENIAGSEVISFRSPALRMSDYTVRALMETGYKIDSSVASQRFDLFLSFGGIQKLKWLGAPRLPYRASKESIYRKGDSGIIEVPLSAMLFPYVGTTLRVFPLITNILKHLIHLETSLSGKPVVFDIHPNEFIDEFDQKRAVNSRSENFVEYLLQDLIRSKLKIRNLGPDAVPLYEKQIKFFQGKGYRFLPIREYVVEQGFQL